MSNMNSLRGRWSSVTFLIAQRCVQRTVDGVGVGQGMQRLGNELMFNSKSGEEKDWPMPFDRGPS
jgi:hypothetical protein